MAVSRTSSNCADLRNVGILIMLIWAIKFSIVKGVCTEPDIDALPTDSRCSRPLLKMRQCGTRTPTVCSMSQNVTQVFHGYRVDGATEMRDLKTVEQCVNRCIHNPTCFAVDWNTKWKGCWFHGNGSFCSSPRNGSNVDHYKIKSCSSSEWECSTQCSHGCCQQWYNQNQQCCHSSETCPDPGSGENITSHASFRSYNIWEVQQYTCIEGHFFENNSTSKAILCQIGGTWNDTAAQCKPGNCTPPDVGNNATSSKVPPYHVHQHVDFECPTGHVFPDKTSIKTISCTTNLTFNSSIPNCSRVRCKDIGSLPSNLSVSPTGPYLYGSIVNVTCPDGFNMGVDASFVTLSCRSDGTWGGIQPECIKTSSQTADRMTGQPENVVAISAGGGTAAVVVILVVVGFGLIYWRRRSREINNSSQDHKNQPSSSHRPSNVNNDTQDVSETGFSSAVVSSPNAPDDVKLQMKANEQESTIADLYAVPERKKKARACTASDTAGDSVQNPSDLYAVPERKKKKNSQPSAIQGTCEADSDDYQLATHFGDDVSDDDMQMVENDLYEDSDGRLTDVTGMGEPPSEGVVFRENSIYGS